MISPGISAQIAKVDGVDNPRTMVALTVRDLTVPMRGDRPPGQVGLVAHAESRDRSAGRRSLGHKSPVTLGSAVSRSHLAVATGQNTGL
jgi:hypothetical protein